jgi:hypothetical protein
MTEGGYLTTQPQIAQPVPGLTDYSSLGGYSTKVNYGLAPAQPQFGLTANPDALYKSSLSTFGPTGAPPAAAYSPSAFDKAFGWRDADGAHMGYAGAALGGANLLMSGYLGLQQLAVAKDTLENAKKQFSLNFANQAKTTNAALEDRQRARVASNAGAYQSVGDYMNQNRVNGVA